MPSATPSLGTAMSLVSAEPPNARQVERQDDVPVGQLRRDALRRLQLDPVALVIVDGQRQHGKARLARQRGADHRIQPARQQDDGHRLMSDQSFRAPSSGARRQKNRAAPNGRPSCGPKPDREESVPKKGTVQPIAELWLKPRLTEPSGSAIAHAARVKLVMERQTSEMPCVSIAAMRGVTSVIFDWPKPPLGQL